MPFPTILLMFCISQLTPPVDSANELQALHGWFESLLIAAVIALASGYGVLLRMYYVHLKEQQRKEIKLLQLISEHNSLLEQIPDHLNVYRAALEEAINELSDKVSACAQARAQMEGISKALLRRLG